MGNEGVVYNEINTCSLRHPYAAKQSHILSVMLLPGPGRLAPACLSLAVWSWVFGPGRLNPACLSVAVWSGLFGPGWHLKAAWPQLQCGAQQSDGGCSGELLPSMRSAAAAVVVV